ncbi:MFS transporter, CP family, cyanate transporter [Anaerocolumna jejuensis DSM 15929]|uniref:MFS transporter, CP family, cyanate transporter n=1 Tax=Anaerocolumna jejuensis DSM 15929 TaxID=1121322 RepID=A0A1M6JJS1_9FIRM|nr:MFS transporter [Anaerocolumna jejuensis]SHJ46872.1 MFS transporter, CP family, cyanate transporter [Anaerocolumna jejuensis DSM 15929]
MTKHRQKFLVLGIILIAFNLRTPLTAVGPLINSIKIDLNISNSLAGFLTTLPLLIFSFLSPIASKIGIKIGQERTIFYGLLLLAFGMLLRSSGGIFTLFAGTILIGAGITTGNVLIPGIIKRKFPQKIGIMTSTFSTAMSLLAGIASGLSVPLSIKLGLGWRNSLLIWCVLVVAAIIFWIPQTKKQCESNNTKDQNNIQPDTISVWHSPLAWKVALFMGLQSFLFYSFIAWLPEILLSKGLSIETSGFYLSFYQVVSLPTSFVAPIIAEKLKNQRILVASSCLTYVVGILGLLRSDNMVVLTIAVILMAFAGGACISLSFTFFGLRSSNTKQAAELSGMAQSVGYLLAAAGPVLLGSLFDLTDSWTLPILFLSGVTLILLYVGVQAGQNERIS